MHSYAAFGTRLTCTFELPELVPAEPSAHRGWIFETHETAAPAHDATLAGADTVYGSIAVRLSATPSGFRLEFDDTGVFDVHTSDRTIRWYPGTRRDGTAVRADLLGRVMAVAAHADGDLALHASAVSIDGAAIAFLGPKHAGKSTLAMALVRRGARLLADDTLVVRFAADGAAWATPGVQRVRLWDDSARALGAVPGVASGAKPTLDALPAEHLESADVPLSACYVVRPASDVSDVVVSRDALSSRHAALACVSFSKLGALAGRREGSVVLDRATRLTRTSSFYLATVHRDLHRLDALADEIIGWHRGLLTPASAAR